MRVRRYQEGRSDEGGALLVAIVTLTLMGGLSAAMLALNGAATRERQHAHDQVRAMTVAQAGAYAALAEVRTAIQSGRDPADIGSAEDPAFIGGQAYWAEIVDEGEGSYKIIATGSTSSNERVLEVQAMKVGGGVFSHALFAGNTDEDPDYVMELGGDGDDGDEVTGDTYSGGDLLVSGDAQIGGEVSARGSISGWDGTSGVSLPVPDLESMDYENSSDWDVARLFRRATYQWDDAGGSAWQVPEENPAHIFRKNPSDRSNSWSSTVKDDYFLEDPYEQVQVDANWDGSDAYQITLSGTNGEPGPDGNDAIYYIDGNLWVHNLPTYSFKFVHADGEAAKVTFVVKGNITFSDNVFYHDDELDGVLFIALEDDAVEDSGNIYFGDPVGGTIEHMDCFMYAENDFYDINLNAAGSMRVTVNGNMSAGNQVAIERDHDNGSHSKLTVDLDERIMNGTLDQPGLPPWSGGQLGVEVASWREISARYGNIQ